MRLRQVYVRFFKSLNYDYEFKARHPEAEAEWQRTDQGWLPHIRIPLEADITAVVGANESGKSQLLDAIEILLGEKPNERRGFCRYSAVYSVEDGERRLPEFAADLQVETPAETTLVRSLGIRLGKDKTFFFCRPGGEPAYVSTKAGGAKIELAPSQLGELETAFPKVFRLRTDGELPEIVPIFQLAPSGSAEPVPSRGARNSILRLLMGAQDEPLTTENTDEIVAHAHTEEEVAGIALARALLTEVAHISPDSFLELGEAMRRNAGEGEVAGLLERMNGSIAKHLNLQRWWTQDEAFELRLDIREHEVTFSVRDRTGTVYSISERSRGLKYFLAYFVNLLTHPRPSGRRELVLIDEPDAYLSAAGQQDLLRLIEDYSLNSAPSGAQTVYVTHSPFLINKNAGHRIRVIEKGVGEEGTRLVKDAAHNRYEPLRTALGAFVAETAFIGGSNLFVEGPGDQILLAGISSYRLRRGAGPSECLDLNRSTVVQCGGADSVPYMTFLARGRGEIKPPSVALLDGDSSGRDAIKRLRKIEANGKRVLADEFIVDLKAWAEDTNGLRLDEAVRVEEIEDLIPLPVAVEAMRRYAIHLLGSPEKDLNAIEIELVRSKLAESEGALWDACESAFATACGERLEKVGFAREVVDLLSEPRRGRNRAPGIPDLEHNFGSLISYLAERLRRASEVEAAARRSRRLERIVDGFIADFPTPCIRDNAALMIREVESAADETDAGDALLAGARALERDFRLNAEPLELVPNYVEFIDRVRQLKYLGK